MRFKKYLQTEGVIVPDKINIKTTNIDNLNKQFKHSIIEFKLSDGGPHAGYVPALDKIIVYVDPEMPTSALEALIQHELIHLLQDKKSGGRMASNIQKEFEKLREIEEYINDLDDDDKVPIELVKLYNDLKTKMEFLNPEEEMAYSYMYTKMYKKLPVKEVIKKMSNEWKEWTSKKPSKRMLKYFYSYWIIRKDL